MSTRKRPRTARATMAAVAGAVAAGPPEADFGVLLTVALEAFKHRLHTHLARAGYGDLGPSFGFVFRSLAERPLSLVELAARLGITPQGALKIVADMVERGYVERLDDPADRRVRRLLLSTRGRGALREARRFHASAERQLAEALGAERVADARAVLEAVAAEAALDVAAWAGTARPF